MKKWTQIIVVFILFNCCGFNAQAQQTIPDTLEIEEVTVTAAQALLVPKFHLPGSVSQVSSSLLGTTWSRTGAEALENASGVWLQKTNHGGGAPIIRGLTGNQVLMLLDGVRLNNSIYRYGPNQYLSQINPNWIDHIDVKRGSGSVEFGSDALGGVVNIHSRPAFFSNENRLMINLGTTLGSHYRLKDYTQISATGNAYFSNPDFYVKAGYTRSNFGDLLAGGSGLRQIASGYQEDAGNFKYAHRINKNNTISIAWFRDTQTEVGRTDKMNSDYSEYFFDPQIMDLGYLRWTLRTSNSWLKEIKATLSYNRLEESRRMTKKGSVLQKNELDIVNTIGSSVLVSSHISESWTASSGIEYYQDRVNSSAYQMNLIQAIKKTYRGLYTDNSSMQMASLFSNHYIDLGKLHLTFGARLNHSIIQGDDPEFGNFDLAPTAVVGSAGINYQLLKGLAITAQLSNGFRSPNINDISSFGLFDYGFEVPASGLKPEKSLSSEIGLKMFSSKVSGTLTVYQTNLYDLLIRIPSSFEGDTLYQGERVYQKANQDQALVRGIEGDLAWKPIPRLLFSAFGTYTFGEDLQEHLPLRRIPPIFGQIHAEYSFGQKLKTGTTFKMAGQQSRLSAGDIDDDRIPQGGTPGWHCWDLFVSYKTQPWIISVHLLNLTNQDYRIHGSGLQQAGRGFLVKLYSTL